jgi:hypothetical protein
MAEDYVASIVSLDVRSPEFAAKAESIRAVGDADIRVAAVSNRLLDAPMRAAARKGLDAGSQVSQSLLDLRKTIEGSIPRRPQAYEGCSAWFRSATSFATTSSATRAPKPTSTPS